MDIRHSQFETPGHLKLLLEGAGTGAVLVGTASVRAGELLPAEGFSTHEADEYSYVLRGHVRVVTPQESRECAAGTLMLLRAGEPHRVEALSDSEVLWWWSGQPESYAPLKEKYPLPTS